MVKSLFDPEACVTVLRFVGNGQCSFKMLKHLLAQLLGSLWIGRHVSTPRLRDNSLASRLNSCGAVALDSDYFRLRTRAAPTNKTRAQAISTKKSAPRLRLKSKPVPKVSRTADSPSSTPNGEKPWYFGFIALPPPIAAYFRRQHLTRVSSARQQKLVCFGETKKRRRPRGTEPAAFKGLTKTTPAAWRSERVLRQYNPQALDSVPPVDILNNCRSGAPAPHRECVLSKRPRSKMPPEEHNWSVYKTAKKGHLLGHVVAATEAQAIERAIEELQIREVDRFRITVKRG
jgi:hypothetical protein